MIQARFWRREPSKADWRLWAGAAPGGVRHRGLQMRAVVEQAVVPAARVGCGSRVESGGLDQGQKHLVAYGLLFGKELVQEHRAHVGLQIDGRPLIGEGHHPRRCGRTDAGSASNPS